MPLKKLAAIFIRIMEETVQNRKMEERRKKIKVNNEQGFQTQYFLKSVQTKRVNDYHLTKVL